MAQYLALPIRRKSVWVEDGASSTNVALHLHKAVSRSSIPTPDLPKYQTDLAAHLNQFTKYNSEVVKINVGGQFFETHTCTLLSVPKTRLAELDETSPFYNENTKYYFFDRNPTIFQCILDFYRDGEMHIPKDICVRQIESEISFWQLNISCLATCCKKYYEDALDEISAHEALLEEFKNTPSSIYSHSKTYQHCDTLNWRNKIWEFLDDFSSSVYAKIWHTVYMVLVVTSVLMFFTSTLEACRVPANESIYRLRSEWQVENTSLETHKIRKLVKTSPHPALEIIELFCLIFFTLEFVLRFTVCPWKIRLLKNTTTFIDLLYLVPTWLVVIVESVHAPFWRMKHGITIFVALEAIEVFRVFRIFRFIKHYRVLRMLYLAIKSSLSELGMLLIFVALNTTFCACFVYCAELYSDEFFNNAFHGMWWALITMTTVGYGDMYPVTWLGYLVGCVCALTGIILIQMPVPIIVSNFHAYYGLRVPPDDNTKSSYQNFQESRKPSIRTIETTPSKELITDERHSPLNNENKDNDRMQSPTNKIKSPHGNTVDILVQSSSETSLKPIEEVKNNVKIDENTDDSNDEWTFPTINIVHPSTNVVNIFVESHDDTNTNTDEI